MGPQLDIAMQVQPVFVKSMMFANQTLSTWFKESVMNFFMQ